VHDDNSNHEALNSGTVESDQTPNKTAVSIAAFKFYAHSNTQGADVYPPFKRLLEMNVHYPTKKNFPTAKEEQ
jgi:hypothetical protein